MQAVALLTIGSPLGNMFGSLFGGALLDLNGLLGLAGWQWVFIVTGAPAVILFVLILRYLPDNPLKANFLAPAEKVWLADELNRDEIAATIHTNPLRVLIDLRVWGFALVYTMITRALYGIIYWLPTVVRGFGTTGTQNGLLNALPWAVAGFVLVWLPRHLREHRTVLVGMALIALCGMAAFFTSTMLTQNWMRYVALAVGTPCVCCCSPASGIYRRRSSRAHTRRRRSPRSA